MSNLYVITGPSGVGKTTIAYRLLKDLPHLKKIITYTTRQPRPSEENGVDYNFVDDQTFQKMINDNEMFEWAEVYDQKYGSRRQDVEQLISRDHDVLMVVDIQGAKTIKEIIPKTQLICLLADSPDILIKRLKHRDQNTDDDLETRLAKLQNELAYSETCQHVIVNKEGEIEQTLAQIKEIISKT